MKEIVLMDTSIGGYNKGDEIIMDSATRGLADILSTGFCTRFPTHTQPGAWYQIIKNWRYDNLKHANYKFICGTDIVIQNMLTRVPRLNVNLFNCGPLCNSVLVGVGCSGSDSFEKNVNAYTKKLYSKVFSKDYIHSTRDEKTKVVLEKIGFKAVNTGCVTLWPLTKQHCSEISDTKADSVVFSVAAKDKFIEADRKLLDILKRNYKKVYIWIQTMDDMPYLKRVGRLDDTEFINPSLQTYDQFLNSVDCDYVGARLHGGIFAMQHKKRSIILSVDYRASEMQRTFNINCIPNENTDEIESKINSRFETKVNINEELINNWKAQFLG